MDIDKFIEKRPYLYHLTDTDNWNNIIQKRELFSTNTIASQALNEKDFLSFVTTRRESHEKLTIEGSEISIRDQRPISLKVLARSLTPGWDVKRFLKNLNSRVFFWPTISRLSKHFARYEEESPIILRFNTKDIINRNKAIELARLNTGATRCSHFYGGNAPTRGQGTFLSFEEVSYSIGEVAEFTILDSCKLPSEFWIGNSPNGPWELIN